MEESKKFDKVKYDNQYIKDNKDRLSFLMPKGRKAEIQAYARSAGVTASEWINQAILEKMERQDKAFTETVTREKIEE